jgi:hypothetical protein
MITVSKSARKYIIHLDTIEPHCFHGLVIFGAEAEVFPAAINLENGESAAIFAIYSGFGSE